LCPDHHPVAHDPQSSFVDVELMFRRLPTPSREDRAGRPGRFGNEGSPTFGRLKGRYEDELDEGEASRSVIVRCRCNDGADSLLTGIRVSGSRSGNESSASTGLADIQAVDDSP
jgi:hypothetical protein